MRPTDPANSTRFICLSRRPDGNSRTQGRQQEGVQLLLDSRRQGEHPSHFRKVQRRQDHSKDRRLWGGVSLNLRESGRLPASSGRFSLFGYHTRFSVRALDLPTACAWPLVFLAYIDNEPCNPLWGNISSPSCFFLVDASHRPKWGRYTEILLVYHVTSAHLYLRIYLDLYPVLARTLDVARSPNSVLHDGTIAAMYTSQERSPFNPFPQRCVPRPSFKYPHAYIPPFL